MAAVGSGALKEDRAERLCREIVDKAPDAIIYADREGLIGLWNLGAEVIFGYSATEAIGRSLDLIILKPCERATGRATTR